MRLEGRGVVVEIARRLHAGLIRERACGCTSQAPVERIDPRLAVEISGVPQTVALGSPITGVATITVGGVSGSVQTSVAGALVQGALEVAAGGSAKAGPAEVVVTAQITYAGQTRARAGRRRLRHHERVPGHVPAAGNVYG